MWLEMADIILDIQWCTRAITYLETEALMHCILLNMV